MRNMSVLVLNFFLTIGGPVKNCWRAELWPTGRMVAAGRMLATGRMLHTSGVTPTGCSVNSLLRTEQCKSCQLLQLPPARQQPRRHVNLARSCLEAGLRCVNAQLRQGYQVVLLHNFIQSKYQCHPSAIVC